MAINFLHDINLNGNQAQNLVLHYAGTDPASATEGQIYYNTASGTVRSYLNVGTFASPTLQWTELSTSDGDITNVIAGTRLDGGGTAGDVTLSLDSATVSQILANTGKFTNVTTNLTITGTTVARTIVSSDGTDAVIPVATASVSGVMSAAQVNTLNGKAPNFSPALTGTPTAPTAAANTNTTQVATTAYVQTELTDLIGGAPGALDTLNELATAIGDDASYASTITTALGLKAPLASPIFTGTVGGITKAMVGLGNVANIAVSGSNTGDETSASTSEEGIVERADDTEALTGTDTTRYVTPKHLADRTFTDTIGNGSLTSIAVTHSLGTRAVIVQMFDTSSWETIYAQVVRTDADTVTVGFSTAPATNDVTIMITKVQ